MNEGISPSELDEQIKRAKLKVAQADWGEKEAAGGVLKDLVLQRGRLRRNLDKMSERMHQAAEEAEKSGVGTGGKGSLND